MDGGRGHLLGRIEMPLALGMVGGPFKVLRVQSARELAEAAVGLSQSFAAVRALGSVGIQKGHRELHARCVMVT